MFYIIEKESQLDSISPFGDCFIKFIPKNNNFHPALTNLSLIYLKPLNGRKGFIFCLEHNESFNLNKKKVEEFLINKTSKLFVLNKKDTMYWFSDESKLFDINFIELFNPDTIINNCFDFYYKKHYDLENVNCLIPISKHFEVCEEIFNKVLPIIKRYKESDHVFKFNNNISSNVFYQLEKTGIQLDKHKFTKYYENKITNPKFNLFNGKIYSKYNLYNITSRPSNTFNNINFAALKKDDGERDCYVPKFDKFVELDFQGYHPRLIGELVGMDFAKDRNVYDILGEILNVPPKEAKELTFKQIYGGVWSEYQYKPFFQDVIKYTDELWETLQYGGEIICDNKVFKRNELHDMNQQKLLNYVIQSKETSNNVKILSDLLLYLKDKKTKIVLYTYDSFLFDYSKDDGNIFNDIVTLLKYPVNVKHGLTYQFLENL